MEPKTVGLLKKFESIKSHAQDLYKSLETFESQRIQARSYDAPNETIEIRDLERDKVEETKMILDEYWNSSYDVSKVLNFSIPYFSPPSTVDEAKGVLRRISIECDRVIGALSTFVTPLLREDVDRLNQLRSLIADVAKELDPNYEKNLNEAIIECEKGHFLASALITGRVIIYILDQIEGKTDEEKIKVLQDKNIIERDRKDVKEFIIKASKKARNIFSHDIKIFADPSDTLGLLSDSVKLLEILAKLKVS